MTPLDYALTSVERLKGFLLDKQAGKTVPSILIRTELDLLTRRLAEVGEPEVTGPVVFDLTLYRQRQLAIGELDEMPLAAHGVEELSDE